MDNPVRPHRSLLMISIWHRLVAAVGLCLVLWAAVAWALRDTP